MEDLLIAPVWHGRIQATDLIVISDVQHLSQSWRSTGNNVRDEELSISIVVKRTQCTNIGCIYMHTVLRSVL